MIQYNKTKHFKLLQSFPKSQNLRKNIPVSDEEFLKFLDQPDEICSELQTYSVMLISHLHWENREHYFELIEKLIHGPINFLQLRTKHRAINDTREMLEAGLILLEPNPKSEGFANLIDELVSLFDRFCPDPTLRENHEFSEEELKKLIQTIFTQMKDRYP